MDTDQVLLEILAAVTEKGDAAPAPRTGAEAESAARHA